MNGSIKIPLLFGKYYEVYGGPYRNRPQHMVGVNMAKELAHLESAVGIPTRDFDVPMLTDLHNGLEDAIEHLMDDSPVYVGCMGGIGRTGLFLAILVKAFGVKDPVAYVRKNYLPHAVETRQQQEYVTKFKPSHRATQMVCMAKLLSILRMHKKLTKNS